MYIKPPPTNKVQHTNLKRPSGSHPKVVGGQSSLTYIIDFLNVFSDYREMLYKKYNLDFHTYKEINLKADLHNYFKFFTEKFIDKLKLNKFGKFIFIIKKFPLIESFVPELLTTYSEFDFEFVIIYSKLNNQVFDKNKDDVLCKFFNNEIADSIVITNDLYSDMEEYISIFDKVSIVFVIYKHQQQNHYTKKKQNIIINKMNIHKEFNRRCLPKKIIKNLI